MDSNRSNGSSSIIPVFSFGILSFLYIYLYKIVPGLINEAIKNIVLFKPKIDSDPVNRLINRFSVKFKLTVASKAG